MQTIVSRFDSPVMKHFSLSLPVSLFMCVYACLYICLLVYIRIDSYLDELVCVDIAMEGLILETFCQEHLAIVNETKIMKRISVRASFIVPIISLTLTRLQCSSPKGGTLFSPTNIQVKMLLQTKESHGEMFNYLASFLSINMKTHHASHFKQVR